MVNNYIEEQNNMILGQGNVYSLDCFKTQRNNNVLVVGASGSGKTRGIVIPNLIMATGSYIVSDPKGNLYSKYKDYLEKRGYEVKKLDFTRPEESAHYNFFKYINSVQDVVKLAHMMIFQQTERRSNDPFWDEADRLLLQTAISYVMEYIKPEQRKLSEVFQFIEDCMTPVGSEQGITVADKKIAILNAFNENSYACKTYRKFRAATDKTMRSILITVNSRLGAFDTPEISELTGTDDIDIKSIGKKKTALFVVVSDTDRSLDGLVNIFFTQAMNELCSFADRECRDNRLPVPVRFILDDFATNCKIEEFPRMIASIRSRGISTMLMIQAESQLDKCYGSDGKTIIGNCDTYVYLGGNDVETAKAVAERCDVPVKKILNMPVGTNWIFRRGEVPCNGLNVNIANSLNKKGLQKATDKDEKGKENEYKKEEKEIFSVYGN